MSEKMASRQYFKGFALLAMLMTNPGLTWGQDSTSPTPEEGTTPMPAASAAPTSPDTATSAGTTIPGSTPPTGTPPPSSTSPSASASATPTPTATAVSTTTGSGNTNAATTASGYNVTMTSMISCRQFTCNESQCYSIFINQTATPCNANFSYCQLQRVAYMSYTVGCSANCTTTPCTNQTQTGCSVGCCNTTDCLNVTMSTMVPTTAAPTTTKTTTKAPTTTTQGSNGKKCNQLTCTGETCYTQASQKTLVVACLVGQDYCQLKKTVAGAVMTWKAGCSGDCRKDTPCSSTAVDCTQECCNATLASSCLKLDGTLNIPGSASGPALGPAPLLLAHALLAWLLASQFHVQ
ncbi:mucin-5AC [Anguilla rostrata]|uniref:mucin-5AC n=1 Tax=Anguilla rostrata TaxID=7938 RepID=UPI0030CFD374